MADKPFPNLFSPIQVGSKTLKHRMNLGAHTANMSVEGLPGARHKGYYEERALGGAAMIVVEPMPVHPAAVFKRGCFRPADDAVIEPFAEIVDACQGHGAVMLQQLLHIGAHGDYDNSYHANWSPSGMPGYHDSDGSHAMTDAEVRETIDGFVAAAKRCKASGFDGIDLFAAYNALIDQFWSPLCNTRDDEWGGTFEKRMAFSAQICRRIRDEIGPDFIIGLSICGDDLMPDSLNVEAMAEICAWHDGNGLIDYVSVGTGSYFDFSALIPTFLYPEKLGPEYSQHIKAAVSNAKVQAESHIRTPENADYVIASGQADMVSIVRGQIADPHLATKAMQGRAEDIRPCISCNQMCWGRRSRDYHISCLVNPSVGREHEWGGDRYIPAGSPKSVLVVGGGPAGMETARVLAERGHRVTLAEASDRLGGQFRLAGLQPRRAQILDLIQWYETQLTKLQVKVLFNSPLDVDEALAIGADAIVVATGSQPRGDGYQRMYPHRPSLPGLENGNVWSVEDVMGKAARLGERVLLVDDGGTWRGAGTAWAMAEDGKQVTLVTPDPLIGKELQRTAADFMLRKKLKALNVREILNTALRQWHGNGATLASVLDGEETEIKADSLVLATPNASERSLYDAIAAASPETDLHLVGDAVAPRLAPAATFEGRKLGLAL